MTTKPDISGGGVLGQKVEGTRRQLDTFELPRSNSEVTYRSDEVMSHCPITTQPDFYVVEITLLHSPKGLESKSLKLYLQSFVEDGQFCEAFTDRIAQDVAEASQADGVRVTLTQKPRGGVSIISTSYLSKSPGGNYS